jgi:hypothetical protein
LSEKAPGIREEEEEGEREKKMGGRGRARGRGRGRKRERKTKREGVRETETDRERHHHDRQGPSTVSIEHEISVNSAFSNSKPMPYMHAYRPPMSASPPVIIKTPVASTACPTNCSTSCMPSRPASAHRWEMQGSQSTDQVRLHMKPYMYAIYVCPSKTSYEALHVCHTCMPYMLPYMYAASGRCIKDVSRWEANALFVCVFECLDA